MKFVCHGVRVGLGGVILFAGILKLVAGEALAVEGLRMFGFGDDGWSPVWRAVQAIAVLECVLGGMMLWFTRASRWILILGAVLLGFIGWDVGRFMTDGTVDCGCLGSITLATEWWHVWMKHALLLSFFVLLARTNRMTSR